MFPTTSIQSYLRSREIGDHRLTEAYESRQLYRTVVPDETIFDVECPNAIVFKKFSLDGQSYFFHQSGFYEKHTREANEPDAICDLTFDDFFGLQYETQLTFGVELLCKDFCLFTSDNKYMILASALPSSVTPAEGIRNPSSLTCIPSLDDVTFHVIHLRTGKVCYTKTFTADYIYLSHHSGVNLFGPYIAITSIQHQCISIFLIKDSGEFVATHTVGSFLYPEDEYLLSFAPPSPRSSEAGSGESVMSHAAVFGIKHRILAFLYKMAIRSADARNDIRFYYYSYSRILSLIMWKSQFLDAHHLLIKFGSPDYIIGRHSDHVSQMAFFVIYNVSTTEIVSIFNNSSEELLSLYENFCDFFRPAYSAAAPSGFFSSSSNNEFERENLRKVFLTIRAAKNGGTGSAIRRTLSFLPFPPQCFSDSPYFDPTLFTFDDKVVSALERPKLSSDFPVKFYSRADHSLLFKLHVGVPHRPSSHRAKKYSTFIFHPTDPFVISIQHTYLQPAIVNFHYRS